MLSVIVPVFNEEQSLPGFIHTASQWDCDHEIIFVDGGSTDSTLSILKGYTVLSGAKGRGPQCRLGAEHANGEYLVFIHADSIVSNESMNAMYAALESGVQWGCLTLRFTTKSFDRVIGHWTANARVRWSGIPFGDQTIFLTRELYDKVGGMPDLPIMEDYELSRRCRAIVPPKQLSAKVHTSPRRFEAGGNIRTMIQMRHLRHLYRKGVDINEIARLYGEGRKTVDE